MNFDRDMLLVDMEKTLLFFRLPFFFFLLCFGKSHFFWLIRVVTQW